MGLAKTYNLKECAVIVNGLPVTGFGEDDAVKIEPNSDLYTKKVGADGEVIRCAVNDKTGRVTFTLSHTSGTNDDFDELAKSGDVVEILIKDLNGRGQWRASQAWIARRPDVTLGKEPGGREWIFDTADLDADDKGTPVLSTL